MIINLPESLDVIVVNTICIDQNSDLQSSSSYVISVEDEIIINSYLRAPISCKEIVSIVTIFSIALIIILVQRLYN
jgi:hypothetical protein